MEERSHVIIMKETECGLGTARLAILKKQVGFEMCYKKFKWTVNLIAPKT